MSSLLETPTKSPPSASVVIATAITAAGRSAKVAAAFGMTAQAVSQWAARGRMPVEFIKPLCDMGHNLVAPTAILEAISRESGRGA